MQNGIDYIREAHNELCRRNLAEFIVYTMPSYDAQWFHEYTCKKIQDWYNGIGKQRLMVFMPPQHGKSQISTRHAPAWILGKNKNEKIGIAAYNGTVSSKFNRDVQRIIKSDEYAGIFPETKLPKSGNSEADSGYVKNNHEFDIVNSTGSLVSVGVGGGLTSRQIDTMIIDDVYKDAKEAWSPTQRLNVWEWYNTVVETRLHNDSRVLIVFTRWHEEDLAGQLLAENPDAWDVVKIQAIREAESVPEDPRTIGEALWESKHGIEKLLAVKSRSLITFENLYQQDPQPAQGMLYSAFKTYESDALKALLIGKAVRYENYTDTADSGSDYLCSITYVRYGGLVYVLDVLYSQESTEITEPLLVDLLVRSDVNTSYIESNAGGRIFARSVKKSYSATGARKCVFKTFTQTENKEARIYAAAGLVNQLVVMPNDWHVRWPKFHHDVTRFAAILKKNKHDDAADVLTGIVERSESGYGQYAYASV